MMMHIPEIVALCIVYSSSTHPKSNHNNKTIDLVLDTIESIQIDFGYIYVRRFMFKMNKYKHKLLIIGNVMNTQHFDERSRLYN